MSSLPGILVAVYVVVAILLPVPLDAIWVFGWPVVAVAVWLLHRRRARSAAPGVPEP